MCIRLATIAKDRLMDEPVVHTKTFVDEYLHCEVHGHTGRHTKGCHLGGMPLDVTLIFLP